MGERSAKEEGRDRQGRAAGATTVFLLAAICLLGVAQISVLPPWEGFDETAHWSYIQELADQHRVPVWGVDKLSADRLSYFGPEPIGLEARGRSYRDLRRYSGVPPLMGPTRYRPDTPLNWQAQHPPLFYVLMVPVYRAVQTLGWVDHLFVLRLVCWLTAFAGLSLGTVAVEGLRRGIATLTVWATPLSLLWPLLFAGFFADLARLGNDCLCLLIVGALLLLLVPVVDGSGPKGPGAPLRALGVGLLLGAGLWTKAFFGPISLGVGALMLARALQDRSTGRTVDAALAIGLAWVLGCGWYLMKLHATGSLTGSDEAVQLVRAGGMMKGLAARFSVLELMRGVRGVAETVGWLGTWSLARLSERGMLLIVLLLAMLIVGYLQTALRDRRPLALFTPLALAGPMALGILYHVFLRLALDGRGTGTPGWYMHVLAPVLGLMLALGWTRPRLLAGLGAVSVCYTAASWIGELGLFSGCVQTDALNHYDFLHASCLIDPHVLTLTGKPLLGAVCLAGAALLGLAAAIVAGFARPSQRPMGETDLVPLYKS